MRKPAPKEITQIGTAQKRLHEDDSAHQSQSSSSSLRPSPKGKMSTTRSTKSNTPSSSAHPESETVLSPSSEPTLWETIERNTLEGVLRVLEVLLVPEVLVKLRSTQKDEKLWSVEPYESDADFVECVAFGIAVHHALNTMQGHHTVGQLVNDVIRKESVRMAAICKALQECEELLISYTTARVVATKSKLLPRALRAAVLLEFTNEESSAFFYILAVNAVPWLSAMPLRLTAPAVGRYAAMSPRAYLNFLSEDRPHFRQGILSSTEMRSLVKSNIRDKEIRMQAEAVAALSGATLTEAELLRLEKSAVATVLSEEGIVFGDATRQGSGAGDRALLDYLGDLVGSVTSPAEECDEEQDEDSSDAELEEMDQVSEEPPVKRIRGANLSKKKKHSVSRRTYHDLSPRLSHQITRGTTELTSPGLSASNPNSSRTNEEVAYTTEIEYLDDVFKYLATLIRLRTLETDMKDEDSDALMLNSRQKTESQLREMQGRERLLKLRYERRLEKSLISGFVPRAEALATTHSLSSFEKLTILLLVGHNISHDILIAANGKYVMRGEAQRECTVGYILFVLCEGLCDRVKQRECFQRTSTLVQEGFVTVSGPSASTASSLSDLSDCLVDIDRKLVDHITGLTTSFADIVDGSSLYTPTVHLDQVVLPEEALEKVQRTVTHYDQFIECRTRIGFSEMGRQGLVMMFCGPSGTGKTMLANAIASRMKKKILLVNVIQYQQSNRTSLSSTDLFKFIFREALLQNAIVFFDECEAFFEGGSSNQLVLSLLVELERYSGLVILATNNPQNIHEAMHRRITLCIQFQTPDYLLRERIWKGHIPQRLRIAENVDFKSLAMNFELTGGLIKNAVLSAIALSVAREESSDPCVTLSDFVEGAKLQLRGLFSASALGIDSDLRHIIPRKSLDAMLLADRTQRQVWDVVRMIKSKNLLLSSWGFNPEEHGDQMCGFVALFYGPSGCGKSMATEGIALECGVSMRVVNLTELILKCSQLSNQIETLFMEARKQNAIIVLDNAEKLLDHSDAALELSQLLQYYAARYPRPIFVLLRTEHAEIDMSATNLLFSTQVRFELPSALIRKQIWQRSFPTGVELASDVDFNVLSLESVSGGVIRTVCFQTCARCAAALGTDVDDQKKRVITMKMLKDELSIVMKQDRDRLPYRALFV